MKNNIQSNYNPFTILSDMLGPRPALGGKTSKFQRSTRVHENFRGVLRGAEKT